MAIPVSSHGSEIWTQTTNDKAGHCPNKVAKTIRRIHFIGPQAQKNTLGIKAANITDKITDYRNGWYNHFGTDSYCILFKT